MTNKHTELPLKVRRWDGDQWPERRVSISNEDEHALFVSARYADIEKAELQAKEIVTAVNNYQRLREALDRLVRSCDNLEYEAGRVALPASDAEDLLSELDNMGNGND